MAGFLTHKPGFSRGMKIDNCIEEKISKYKRQFRLIEKVNTKKSKAILRSLGNWQLVELKK